MTPVAEQTLRRWLARAEGAAVGFTAAVAIVVVLAAWAIAGWPAGQSALLGVGDVFVFFALGAAVDAWGARKANWSGALLVMAGYAARIALLTLTALLLARTPLLTSASWFAIGACAATLTWLAGLIFGHMSGRWPIYDLAGVRP